MSRRSLFLAPALVVALAIPAGAAAAPGKSGSHASVKKLDTPVWGKGRPAGTGGGRRIR